MPDVAPTSAAPTLEIVGAVATIRLNRPAQHNRLEPSDIDVIGDLLEEIEATPGARVAVLRATGPTFCAGYDLSDLARGGESPDPPGGISVFADIVDRLEACRVPTICALNGPVYGGGTDLALACDVRIGVAAAKLRMPAGRFGLHYYHGGLRRYTTRLAPGAARRLFLFGETIGAEEMQRIAYLDEVVPDTDALDRRVDDLVATLLASASATTLNGMKRALNRIDRGDMDPAEADAAWHRTRRAPETAAAVAAQLASRRKPARP